MAVQRLQKTFSSYLPQQVSKGIIIKPECMEIMISDYLRHYH